MMMRFIALCVLLSFPFAVQAEHPMPPMPQGMSVAQHGDCVDGTTEEAGYCVFYAQNDGTAWLVFMQNKQVMFIRHLFEDKPYEQIWTADQFNSI